MKYKLTDEVNQIGLYRIQALKDFGAVKKGDKGGWVKSGSSLSQQGNAWVYGDAWVYGNAWVSGDALVSGNALVSGREDVIQSPINLIGLKYNVTIYGRFMQIGCELHEIKDWFQFSNKQILGMDGGEVLQFWITYKDILKMLCQMEGE